MTAASKRKPGPLARSVRDRIIDSVLLIPFSSCWHWGMHVNRYGYGHIGMPRISGHPKTVRAHRASYECFIGPIPNGMVVHHKCHVRDCVNPDHLEAVTCRDNLMESGLVLSSINERKTVCKRGHSLDGENLRLSLSKRGISRKCRACQSILNRRASVQSISR